MRIVKPFLLIFFFMICVSDGNAQKNDLPNDGAIIKMKESKLLLKNGTSYTSTIFLVRSKKYSKAKFGSIKGSSPEGISVSINPKIDLADAFTMDINVAKDVKAGKYNIVLQGEGKNAHKVKTLVFSLHVTNEDIAEGNN